MTQEQRRNVLIRALLAEDAHYRGVEIPAQANGQRDLLRSLMNVRPPKPISQTLLSLQDEYLVREREGAGIVDGDKLPALPSDGRIVLWQGDITALQADAIVNAANSALLGCFHPLHSCVDNSVHSRSGMQLRLFCADIMRRQGHEEPAGKAKITPAFNLPSQYILHTVGPIVHSRVTQEDRRLLSSCYRSCLELAAQNGCRSIAFCCIATGEFHFPNWEAAEIAVDTVKVFLSADDQLDRVIFNVWKDQDLAIYKTLLGVHG